jgi:hypothetical protein
VNTRDTFAGNRAFQPLLFLLILQLAWLSGARIVTRVGWGNAPRELPNAMVAPGWTTNLSDSLFYASWLQQAKWGGTGGSILYTTTPHYAGYFNPLLWSLGRLSGITGTRPEVWLIITGIVASLACTAAIYSLAHQMGGHAVATAAGFVTIFGSGWTWVQRLMAKLAGWEHYHAADLRFMDILPSSAGFYYPFHTVGLALAAWIIWSLFSAESPSAVSHGRHHVLLAGVLGFLLAWIRPYEPAVLLVIYALYVIHSGLAGDPGAQRRVVLLAVLLVAVSPGLIYSGWLAIQPVWSNFSGRALTLIHTRAFWLQGFGGLWLAAGLGAWLSRGQAGPARFAVIWFVIAVILLPIANTPHTKLLSGVGLPLALLTGTALVAIRNWLHIRISEPLARPLVMVTALLLAGPGSLLIAVRESRLAPPCIEKSLWEISGLIRKNYPSAFPTVLCEHLAGEILPGIIGTRVWAGHWALTDDDEAKFTRLRSAGLEQDSTTGRSGETRIALELLLRDSQADYLLVREGVPAALVTSDIPGLTLLARADRWSLFSCSRTKNS